MASQTKALNYYNYGSTGAVPAPTIQAMVEAETRRMQLPDAKTRTTEKKTRKLDRVKEAAGKKTASGISVFAVLGTLFVATLMVFVVLAQINYNETAGETARLNTLLGELTEKHKALELTFESALDMKEVERFARDELGMSRPDSGQVVIINTAPRDNAVIVAGKEERGVHGFGVFLKSLTEYFR